MDKLKSFIATNKKLLIILGIMLILLVICLVIRANNLSKKEPVDDTPNNDIPVVEQPIDTQESEKDSNYDSNIGLGTGKDDGRIEVTEEESEEDSEPEYIQKEPTYPVKISIWDNTVVPNKTMDGRSFKGYLNKVRLKDFGTYWGTALTDSDFKGNNIYYVGVKQEEGDSSKIDLQSVGWLINNLKNMKQNDAIKFTNLHVIGSLSKNHVALLCCYDWYSAFGLDDTLVVFEDISNTLKVEDFKEGDIFSATVFVHNVKVVNNVNGQRVVVVQFNTFK